MSTLRLPATKQNLEVFRSFVIEQMERLGAKREKMLLVELGLEEFLTNVIKYAYPQGGGDVEVGCCRAENGMLCISIRDWGFPFNPLVQEAPNISEDISLRRIGGLGIYLMRRMFDNVSYEREDGENVVTLCCEG